MRTLPIRSAPKSIKILAAGALVTASAAGYVLSDASAADTWTALTRSDAQFWCGDSNGCNAGGVGAVPHGGHAGKVGEWERTVAISCKFPYRWGQAGYVYKVEVRDTNWSGQWEVNRYFMDVDKQPFDDSVFPNCSGKPVQDEGVGEIGPTNPT
jgi:hypothetical protein